MRAAPEVHLPWSPVCTLRRTPTAPASFAAPLPLRDLVLPLLPGLLLVLLVGLLLLPLLLGLSGETGPAARPAIFMFSPAEKGRGLGVSRGPEEEVRLASRPTQKRPGQRGPAGPPKVQGAGCAAPLLSEPDRSRRRCG